VKYVVTGSPLPTNDPNLALLAADGGVGLDAERQPVGRGLVVISASCIPDDRAAIHRLTADPSAVLHRVILAGPGCQTLVTPGPVAGPLTPPSRVAVIADTASSSTFAVAVTVPSYLVVTDAYYSGWQAELDGLPVSILRADVAFRAISLPPGHHRVTFHDAPVWLIPSIGASLLALLLVVAVLGWSGATDRRASPRPTMNC
jgi:hypothetical protein